MGPRRRRRVRRLDRRTPEPHVHAGGPRHGAPARAPIPAGSADTEQRELTVGTPPTADDHGADRRHARYARRRHRVVRGRATARRPPSRRSQLRWTVDLNHCSAIVPTSCHVHHIQDFAGVASGSFVYPDHEYPSLPHARPDGHERLRPARHDVGAARPEDRRADASTACRRACGSAVGGEASTTPFTRTVAQNSTVGVAAPPSQFLGRLLLRLRVVVGRRRRRAPVHGAERATRPTPPPTPRPSCPVLAGPGRRVGLRRAVRQRGLRQLGRAATPARSPAPRARPTAASAAALSFDGADDLVTIADSNSLDLVSGMTLEAWVNPTALGAPWRTVLLKEQPGNLAYALYAQRRRRAPDRPRRRPRSTSRATGPPLPLNTWTHVAATYDGSTLRLYVERRRRSPASSRSASITVSNGALRIGGNNVWAECFAGRIDEVRVYDRALTAAEVAADMTRPITCAERPRRAVAVGHAGEPLVQRRRAAPSPAAKTLDDRQHRRGHADVDGDRRRAVAERRAGLRHGRGHGHRHADDHGPGRRARYTANVTVSAAGATGSPRSDPGHAHRRPAAARPGARRHARQPRRSAARRAAPSPADRTLDVSNTGGGTLSWTVVRRRAVAERLARRAAPGRGRSRSRPSIAGLPRARTRRTSPSPPRARPARRARSRSPSRVDPPPQPPQLAVAPAALDVQRRPRARRRSRRRRSTSPTPAAGRSTSRPRPTCRG